MRHAGGLRIDHAMGLARLFWVPDGAVPADGAYVHYPVDELLGVLALESARARCFVVGEDLGTVPEGFRERMDAAGVLSYRVLWFERAGADFMAAAHYPAQSAACASTHDLPTVRGWWTGADIAERHRLGHLDAAAAARAEHERERERHALCAALSLPAPALSADRASAPEATTVTIAAHRFIAETPAALVLLQADDLAGEVDAINLPGTDRERPNWRRKIALDATALWDTPIGAAARRDLASHGRTVAGVPGGAAAIDDDN
jgi:glycogen operon protein